MSKDVCLADNSTMKGCMYMVVFLQEKRISVLVCGGGAVYMGELYSE